MNRMLPAVLLLSTKFLFAQESAVDPNSYVEKQIDLYGMQTRYYQDDLKGRIPGVFGKLKNRGNRTVTELKLTVYFKDKSGATIYQKEYYPVLASRLGSGDGPLQPGYIRRFSYRAEGVPAEWEPGSADLVLSDPKFEDDHVNSQGSSSTRLSLPSAWSRLAGLTIIFPLVALVIAVWFLVVSILLPFRVGYILAESRRQTKLLETIVSTLTHPGPLAREAVQRKDDAVVESLEANLARRRAIGDDRGPLAPEYKK